MSGDGSGVHRERLPNILKAVVCNASISNHAPRTTRHLSTYEKQAMLWRSAGRSNQQLVQRMHQHGPRPGDGRHALLKRKGLIEWFSARQNHFARLPHRACPFLF
jgi:hypothetical protein